MSTIILVVAFIAIATVVAFVIITKRTPEPTVASMLRRNDVKEDDYR